MQAIWRSGSSITRAALKFFKVLFLVFLFFLLQTVVMPHLKISGIMPNLMMVIIAIMTVSYGKLYAFISGAVTGIILEAMSYSIPLFYLLIYPVLALLCAQVFADMSDVKREMRRIREAQRQSELANQVTSAYARRKFRIKIRLRRDSPYDLNAHLRILLNALMLVALFEGVMLLYIALSGVSITFNHFLRMLYSAMYTALCCLTMFPVRAWLGLYKRRRPRRQAIEEGEGELTTSRELLRQIALVPDDIPEPKKHGFSFLRKKPRGEKSPAEEDDTRDEAPSSEPQGEVPTE
ncbi:MAG: rod shape-determining protein MreD [Clostridiales bacterium]|mgnify:FL=1|nr:rod shape-determining protein MreD [Clostridiales bacterium]